MTRIGSSQTPPQTPPTDAKAGEGAKSAAPSTAPSITAATPESTTPAEGAPPPAGGSVTDTFDGTRREGGAGTPTDRRLAQAGDRFTTRMQDILNQDALSLSRGETPWRAGQPLSEGQTDQLRDAAKDYLMDVPLGSFTPGVKAGVGALLERAGVRPDNLDSMSLRDVEKHVGDAASDYAEALVDKVKDRAPAAYYGVLGAGALAAGGLAYTKGSDALRRLGVKPEMKLGLFHDQIELRAGAQWDARFTNFEPTAGVRTRLSGDRYSLDAEATFTRRGLSDARLNGSFELGPRTSLVGSAEYQSIDSLRDPNPNLSLSGGSERDRLRASLSLLHKPSSNSSLALSASYDNVSGPWVGAGFTLRF